MNENDKLNQLQNELNECREDERHSEDILIQVLCTAGTILGIILGASYMTSNDSPINPLYVLILNDLIFLTAFSYIVVLGIQNLLRYFHIRNLEKQLCLDTSHIEWFHLSSPITTRNPLHIFRSFYTTVHYSAYTISTLCAILFGIGTTCALYEKTAPGDNIAFIALVFPLGFMFLTAIIYFSFCVRAEKMYQFALTYATLHKSKTSSKDSFFSKVLVYFFYPKVKDFQKPFLIVLGFGSGLLLKTGKLTWTLISNQLMNLILTLIVIDFLLYQARYLLNDIRNIKEDQAVQKSDRLPVHFLGEKNSIIAAFSIIVIRISVAIFLIHVAPKHMVFPLTLCAVLLCLSTIIYEIARSHNHNKIIFISVSFGYPLRVLAGILSAWPELFNNCSSLFLNCKLQIFTLSLLLLSYAFLGVFSALMPWAYEALIQKKTNFIIKSHYQLLMKYLGSRYSKFETSHFNKKYFPLKMSGKVMDPWNISYLGSIFSLSAIIIINNYSEKIFFLESITLVIAFLLCISANQKIILTTIIFTIYAIFKGLFFLSTLPMSIFHLYIYGTQILFTLLYFILRYLFDPNFNFFILCKQGLLFIFKVIVGNEAFSYFK